MGFSWGGHVCCCPMVLTPVPVCSQLEGSLVPQAVATLCDMHFTTSPIIQNAGLTAIYRWTCESRLPFKGSQSCRDLGCHQYLFKYPIKTCLWSVPGHCFPKDLCKIKWKMYGRAANWGRNPKYRKKFWLLDHLFGFLDQSSICLQPGRKGCPQLAFSYLINFYSTGPYIKRTVLEEPLCILWLPHTILRCLLWLN